MTDDGIETDKTAEQEQAEPFSAMTFGDATTPPTAVERLRAFEDQHLGKDAVRLHGHVEKGFGSKFKNMPERHHRHYAALEKLVHAEQHLADAHSALIAAEESHQVALTTADKTEVEIDGGESNQRGPTVEEYVAAGYRAKNYPPTGYASRSTSEEIHAAVKAQADGGE